MESALTHACTIKIQNFEGPFDLLFHLIEKSQVSLYDIPINEITDQYMEYLFAMQQMDLEIASEFLVMAATLLHIKSKMLLPEKKDREENTADPRDELVAKLVEYKRYKEFSETLREREKEWEKVFYKLPEAMEFEWEEPVLELSPEELRKVYQELLQRNMKKINPNAGKMAQIIEHEKVSLKSKMREIVRVLISKACLRFTEYFSLHTRSRMEVVTGFLAILELSKLKRVTLEQKSPFAEILVYKKNTGGSLDFEEEEKAVGGH